MKILIIGGTGYVGTSLYLHLKSLGYSVDTLDIEWYGNLVNPKNIKKDFSDLSKDEVQSYDFVILLAGHSSVKMCENVPMSAFRNNVNNFVSLLEKISDNQTLIYASSSSVYGNYKNRLAKETDKDITPINSYDFSKYEIDFYAQYSEKKTIGLRFGSVSGASPNFRNDIMINSMVYNGLLNGKIYCFNPEVHRPILGLADLIRCVQAILSSKDPARSKIYNLTSFNSTSLEIAESVSNLLKCDLEVVNSLPENVTNVKLQTNAYDFCIDTSLFSQEFNFKFQETTESIVESIMKNFKNMNFLGRTDGKIY